MKKVLIADDNLQIRMLAKAALRSLDCVILEAEDGEATVDVAVSEHPDLILLDVMMPKLDGFEVLHFLNQRDDTCDCRIVMFTTAAQQDDMDRAAEEGVDGYIVKPFDPKQLRDIVVEVLED